MQNIDIKLDNIVVDFDQDGKLSKIKIIDLGDSVRIEPTTDHPFTNPICRAPEGLFGLPWTIKVDLWALGTLVCVQRPRVIVSRLLICAQIMWGLTGGKTFSPLKIDEKDEIYLVTILMLQCAHFGPFPEKFVELSDDITMEHLYGIEGLVTQSGGRKIYKDTLAFHFDKETLDFLSRCMKLDPRDRPSAQDLLQDRWLSGIAE